MSQIMTRKAEYLKAYEENTSANRKRVEISHYQEMQDIDDLTFKWFQQTRGNNIPVSGPLSNV